MPRQEESYEAVEYTRVRKTIAQHTLSSAREVPQFHIRTLVDMEPLATLRGRLKEAGGERVPSYNDLMMKAAALALREHRRFCAWVYDDEIRILDHINIGFAVGTDQGVLMPTVREVDRKSLGELAAETAELIELARVGKLRASLQMGAGFSISNLGPVGIDAFAPIISPPQAGILGVGSIKPQPMVADGQVVARPATYLTLVMDHRANDGADGAAFLANLAAIFATPERLSES